MRGGVYYLSGLRYELRKAYVFVDALKCRVFFDSYRKNILTYRRDMYVKGKNEE